MNQQPHEVIWSLTTAAVGCRCLQIIAEQGVADLIGAEPVGVTELAQRCDADPDALDRVLQLLAAHGIFAYQSGAYAHTEASRLLRTDHPMSMRGFPRMFGLPIIRQSIADLEHSLRTGAPAAELIEPRGLWAYLQDNPRETEIFDAAMVAKAAADIAAVLDAYDFSGFGTVADIGGGRGHLLRALLDAVPAAAGILFDLPQVIDSLDIHHDRLKSLAGDFFVDPLPPADAYLLMEVIHDWADAEAVAILTAVRRAAVPGATVLIVEGVLDPDRPDPRVQTLDVVMLVGTGGRERSPAQFGELLDRAGLRLTRVIPTQGPLSLVEAKVV